VSLVGDFLHGDYRSVANALICIYGQPSILRNANLRASHEHGRCGVLSFSTAYSRLKVSTALITSRSRAITKQSERQLSPLQLLTHIQSHLLSAIHTIGIPYIPLVRTCNKLQRQIGAAIKAWLKVGHQNRSAHAGTRV